MDGEPGPPGIEHGGSQASGGPLRPGVPPPGVRLPPGPPPGRPQGVPGMGQLALPPRPGVAPAGVRPPPGPPPGVPPSRGAPPGVPPAVRPNMPKPLGVLSAKPQINKQVHYFLFQLSVNQICYSTDRLLVSDESSVDFVSERKDFNLMDISELLGEYGNEMTGGFGRTCILKTALLGRPFL